MSSAMRKTTKTSVVRRLAAAAVALGSCLALVGPAESAGAAPADPGPTVFFGDSYTANFGIAPFNQDGDRTFCFQAEEMKKAVADAGAGFVDLHDDTGSNTACDGLKAEQVADQAEQVFNGRSRLDGVYPLPA